MSRSCAACGGSVRPEARFCRSCGAALDLGVDLAPGRDPGLAPLASAPGSVRRDAPTRWWLAALAAVAVLAAGWAAVSSGGGGAAPADREQTGGAGGDASGSSPSTDDPIPTEPVTTAPPITMKVVQEGTGPVLGGPVGWSLLTGDAYNLDGRLYRLDLDTGQLVRYPKVSGGPVLLVGDRLLLVSSRPEIRSGYLRAVSVRDPSGPSVELDASGTITPDGIVEADAGVRDAVWVYGATGTSARWTLHSVVTGAVLDEVAVGGAGSGWPVAGSGPELATSGSSGVYRWGAGDGYRLLASGRPVAAAGGDVLVQSCTSPLVCPLAWIDGATGVAVDGPIPPADGRVLWYGLVPGSDRYLNGERWTAGPGVFEGVIFDLVTGRLVELDRARWGIASSPDGRYLLASDYSGSGDVWAVYDAETGAVHPLPRFLPVMLGLGQAVFVPNG